jgi:tRNA (guanine-N7-)-methyltransferase
VRRGPRLPLEQLRPYLLEAPSEDHPGRLDWREVFGNDHPVEVEVGFGKGLFLLTAAGAEPGTNFIGVEVVRKYQLFTATRLAKRGLPNVRLACADARLFFRDHVATASVRAVHVYFPDPWWKKRHHKRRLFTPEFAAECARVLAPGGHLHVVTDVEDYSHLIADLLTEQPALSLLPPPELRQPAHDLDYLTNFERKFRKEGRPIYPRTYVKGEGIS